MVAADRRFSWHEASSGPGLRGPNAGPGLRGPNADPGLGAAPDDVAEAGPSAPVGPSAATQLADLLRADLAPGTVLGRTA
jgi:hypothetical protein